MDTSTIIRNRRRAYAALALPKSAAAQLKRDGIDYNNHASPAELVIESNPPAETQPDAVPTHEVVLSTAAAVAVPRTRWWTAATRVVASAVRRVFASLSAESRPKPSYLPARYSFLEDALMSREMDRL